MSLRDLRSVNCLLVLIAVCVRRRLSFTEVIEISGVKKSTAWDCILFLEEKEYVEVRKALTLTGPRTLVFCKERGLNALKELKDALKGLE